MAGMRSMENIVLQTSLILATSVSEVAPSIIQIMPMNYTTMFAG